MPESPIGSSLQEFLRLLTDALPPPPGQRHMIGLVDGKLAVYLRTDKHEYEIVWDENDRARTPAELVSDVLVLWKPMAARAV